MRADMTPGKVMDRRDVRIFFDQHFCGCGSPEAAAAAVLRLLRLHPLYEHRADFEAWIADEGIEYFLLYWLDRNELTEHGTSVGGAWLTDRGKALLDALAREEADGFEALFAQHCIHGYDVDDREHKCIEVP